MDYNKAVVIIPSIAEKASLLKSMVSQIITAYYSEKNAIESEVSLLKPLLNGYSCDLTLKDAHKNDYGMESRFEMEFHVKSAEGYSSDLVKSIIIWGANRSAIELLTEKQEVLVKDMQLGLRNSGIPSVVFAITDYNEHFLDDIETIIFLLKKNDVTTMVY